MRPVLFYLPGGIPIHSYGLLCAIGFFVAVGVVKFLAGKSRINLERALDLMFWGILVSLLGARLLYVLTQWSYFVENPEALFKFWEGGLVFYGGFLLALIYAYVWARHRRVPFSQLHQGHRWLIFQRQKMRET